MGGKDESRDLHRTTASVTEAVRIQWDALSTDQQVLNQAGAHKAVSLGSGTLGRLWISFVPPFPAPNLSQKPSA